MNKKRTFLLAAGLIVVPTLMLFLVTFFVQPLLPAPWNNALILLGVIVAAVLAALSGITDTISLAEKLRGETDTPADEPSIQAERVATLVAGDVNVNLLTEAAAATFLSMWQRPPVNAVETTRQYLNYLVNRYRYLEFKGMGVADRVPLKLSLPEMYVPLKARIEMPEGETWARKLHLAGRQMSAEEVETVGTRLSEPRPVLELLRENAGLIILGDPGAGKTTFLKYLALGLALGQELGLGKRLPVLLPLSAYANRLAEKEVALPDFIADYYKNILGDQLPVGDLLETALQEGRALLLLDGLDEVKETARRHKVVERVVQFFSFRQQQGNKFILTSRIVGYKEVRPTADGLAECTLVDFEEAEIEQFVDKWTAAVERAAQEDPQLAAQEAQREKEELLLATANNPGVRRLAANPLLLTILALMKRQGVNLPERRVELYEQYVRTLLKHWNLARGLDRAATRDLDVVETVRVLAPLALWMHETSPGVGLVKQHALQERLKAILTERGQTEPELAAQQLLQDAHDHAGLLLERGQGTYGFIHLTFQEYLAAVGVAQKGQKEITPVVETLARHVDDDNWREVTLLTIGYLGIVQQRDEAAGDVLHQLLAGRPGAPGQAEIVAGEAVADAWPGGVPPACREEVVGALLAAVRDDGRVAPAQRAKAGQVLARLGDPRPEVMTVDGMMLCYVPPGPFWMGSEDGRDDEKPQHWLEMPAGYWLGQYPVTNAQYRKFREDGGYEQVGYWTEAKAAKVWQGGKVTGWLEDNPRNQPVQIRHPFDLPNHPVVGITWYEALAFTRWLSARWRQKGWLPDGWQVCLPSEAEWEKAAQGGGQIPQTPQIRPVSQLAAETTPTIPLLANGRAQERYIWGAEPEANRANYKASGIGSTNAVGCFPGGVSPYGVEEMAGNMFEWTKSKYGGYEYQTSDGRETLDGTDDSRVLRGGYYGDDEGAWLRCAFRSWLFPRLVHGGLGLRVCVSPISPPL